MEVVLDAGADDLQTDEQAFHVITSPDVFGAVRDALESAGITASEATFTMEPQNTVQIDGKRAQQCLKLLEVLEDHDDVQNVHANPEFDDADLEATAG